MVLVHRVSPCVSFSKNVIFKMDQEFLLLQSFDLSAFDDCVKDDVAIRSSGDRKNVSYRINRLWYYLYQMKVPGIEKSKFDQLFKLAKVVLVLTIVNNNPEE